MTYINTLEELTNINGRYTIFMNDEGDEVAIPDELEYAVELFEEGEELYYYIED